MKTVEIVNAVLDYYSDPNHYPGLGDGMRCVYYRKLATVAESRCAIGCLLPSASEIEEEVVKTYLTDINSLFTTFKVFESSPIFPQDSDRCLRFREELLNILPEDLTQAEQKGFLGRVQRCHDISALMYPRLEDKLLFVENLRKMLLETLELYTGGSNESTRNSN